VVIVTKYGLHNTGPVCPTVFKGVQSKRLEVLEILPALRYPGHEQTIGTQITLLRRKLSRAFWKLHNKWL
jgi:hypothetical protein